MNPKALNALLSGLTQDQATELQQLLVYLGEKAGPGNPSGEMPEGSVASVINKASPAVRQRMAMLSELIETPRTKPFEEPFSEAEWLRRLGADVPSGLAVKSALDTQEVMHGLQKSMGTDSQLPKQPPSMADLLSAAYDKHQGA